ncbi:MAG TPA: hypothetical protein PK796_10745 [Bacteroidales bacterium]|nr:hypothetical protein [Bacteroidales bacterium]
MKTISDLRGKELQWVQPRLTDPNFELRNGEQLIASLRFKNAFGSFAEGMIDGNTWTFKRQGFLNTHVTIREPGKEENIAVFRNNTWSEGGTLEFPDGLKFTANSNFWREQFEFTDSTGKTLLKLSQVSGIKLHARMEILSLRAELDAHPWIILLGWYLTVMASREGEMVAALF